MMRRDLLAAPSLPVLARLAGAAEAREDAAVPPGSGRQAALDAFLQRQVEQQKVVGIAAQVVRRDGEVVYAGTAGRRDPDAPDAIGPDTLFRLASMTKPVTAVAVLALVEEGHVALDDPLGRFLPEFAAPRVQTRPGDDEPAARPPHDP